MVAGSEGEIQELSVLVEIQKFKSPMLLVEVLSVPLVEVLRPKSHQLVEVFSKTQESSVDKVLRSKSHQLVEVLRSKNDQLVEVFSSKGLQ